METFESRLATGGLGLAGEGGEAADLVKKLLFHGLEFTDEIRDKMVKELGDIMFYVAFTGKFSIEEFLAKENKKVN